MARVVVRPAAPPVNVPGCGAEVTGFDISTGDFMEDGWPDEKPGAASLGAASEFHQ
jgi:hypothetical protein